MRSPGIQHPDELKGAAEADQGQGNLSATKKQKDRNLEFVPGVTRTKVSLQSGSNEER